MADLPEDRVRPDRPPFTSVGLDFFGPFQVLRGHSLVKRYGVIFTCLAIHAVHIEVAFSLDTDSFLLAIQRFIARRGQVKEIYSDNGTNFTSGEQERCYFRVERRENPQFSIAEKYQVDLQPPLRFPFWRYLGKMHTNHQYASSVLTEGTNNQ